MSSLRGVSHYKTNLAADRGSLNLALKDQLTALEWVQANIGAFGGDKEKVFISFYYIYE